MGGNYVPNFEDRYYEVHPSQLRWAMHQLDSVPNYNVRGYTPGQGGMYIIVVQAPVGAPQSDWRDPQPQRRSRFRFDWMRIARGLALAVIAVALAYIAYGMFTGAALGMPQAPQAAPAIVMPWDAAGRQVSETVDGIVRILTAGFVAALIAAVVFVFVKVRGRMK